MFSRLMPQHEYGDSSYWLSGKSGAPDKKVEGKPLAGFLTQCKLLFARSLREITRNKAANVIKLVQQVCEPV